LDLVGSGVSSAPHQRISMNYITLHQVKEYLKISQSNTSDDNIFRNWIKWSSGLIDWWRGRRFDVQQKSILLDVPHFGNKLGDYRLREYTARELYLDVSSLDLLEVIQLLNGDGTEIISNQYYLEPVEYSVKNRIRLKRGLSWKSNDDGERQAIQLTGLFGYNRNYPDCFVNTGEKITSNNGFPVDENSFPVSDVNGIAMDYISPKLQVGQMIRFSSTEGIEFANIIDILEENSNYSIVVDRGVNGTSRYTHPKDTIIEVYRPNDDIVQTALRLVQWRYRQKDQDTFDRTFNLATQTATTPTALPADVRMILGNRRPYLS
jgi:hypothetical protein